MRMMMQVMRMMREMEERKGMSEVVEGRGKSCAEIAPDADEWLGGG